MTMQYGDDFARKFGTFTGDPNFRRPNPFEGAPGFVRSIMPYAATPMNPPTRPIGSMAPGMVLQGRAGFPQSSPLYGGGGVAYEERMTGGMKNPVQGQFSSQALYGGRTPSTSQYLFGQPSFARTQFGQPTTAPFNPYDMAEMFGGHYFLNDPTAPTTPGGSTALKQSLLDPFGEARPRRLDPQYEETAETIRQQGVERDKRGQRRQAARMGTATNVSPDRRQSRTGTGSVPGNPTRKRQEQYKPGLQRRQRGALGDQSIFRQRQTPRRRAASSAGEG